jgi:hypothetical protein
MSVPTGAFVMKNALVKIGSVDYSNQISKVRLVPDTNIQTMKTLVPEGVIQDVDTPTWTVEITAIQDMTDSVGLARYLTENHGTTVAMEVTAKVGGVKATFNVLCMATELGGEQGNFAVIEVELPVVGVVTLVDPV